VTAYLLFSHPPFKYKNNILNRPLGSGRVVSILKFVGLVGLGLLDIGLDQVGSRNLDPCTSLFLPNYVPMRFETMEPSASYGSGRPNKNNRMSCDMG